MFDTLLIGTSGLMANAQGLKIVSNNLANVNTTGFKGSSLQFADLFENGGANTNGGRQQPGGLGVESLGSAINFKQGSDQSTGNAMDQAINGDGLFVMRRDDGQLYYTRAGDFKFNDSNELVNSAGDHVQALDAGGELEDVKLSDLEHNAPLATSTVKVSGNLTTTVASPVVNATLNGVTIIDAAGATHTANLSFKDNGDGSYAVTITDGVSGGAQLGTGTLKFSGGAPVAGSDAITFQYTNSTVPAFAVKLDFTQTDALATATTLAVQSQNGHVAGVRNDQTIDENGTVTVHYSNGQSFQGPRLALAQFGSAADLVQGSGSSFTKADHATAQYGYAGGDFYGSLMAGHLEGSNVDLAEEFSNLILMQRGYQAASHVVSTANDMIQELFDMKGHS